MASISNCTSPTTDRRKDGSDILEINGRDLSKERLITIQWPSWHRDKKFSVGTPQSLLALHKSFISEGLWSINQSNTSVIGTCIFVTFFFLFCISGSVQKCYRSVDRKVLEQYVKEYLKQKFFFFWIILKKKKEKKKPPLKLSLSLALKLRSAEQVNDLMTITSTDRKTNGHELLSTVVRN